jgi:hypothetical protein
MQMVRIQQKLCSASATDSPSSSVGESSAHHHHSPVIGSLLAVIRPAENQPRNRRPFAVIFIVLCFTYLVIYYVLVANNNRQGSGTYNRMSYSSPPAQSLKVYVSMDRKNPAATLDGRDGRQFVITEPGTIRGEI